jgi:four helix bundle protein
MIQIRVSKNSNLVIRRDGPIIKKSVDFSGLIMEFCELLNSKKKYVVANQLLKSGTSIGANVFEAQYAESRIDFIHKMKIALKEASETLYWLRLCENLKDVTVQPETLNGLNEIMAILSKIIITSKKNLET